MIVSTKNMFPKIRTFVCHVFGTFLKKPSKNNLHHLFRSFRSIFIFSSVVYIQYTPSSKRNLYSKIIDKSDAVYFFMFLSRDEKSSTNDNDAPKMKISVPLNRVHLHRGTYCQAAQPPPTQNAHNAQVPSALCALRD